MTTETKQKGKMDMQAMMNVYHKLAIPEEPHELLARMAGSWKTKGKSWMELGSPPTEFTGTSEQKMILGGRFLQQEYVAEFLGSRYKGIGLNGYDNHKKRYVSTWMDSMGTGIMVFEGNIDADGKTITQECRCDDPVKGPVKWRSITRIVDDDTHLFEMYTTDASGKEVKMMEITYSRTRTR
ncbi:MAG: DUF1579 domain-containing protein [Desulfobacterales bacterium]